MSLAALPPVAASWFIILVVVVLVVFAIAIIFAAIWYHLRQPKEVRLDPEDDADERFEEHR